MGSSLKAIFLLSFLDVWGSVHTGRGAHFLPSLAEFPKPQLPLRLQSLYSSRPRGRLLSYQRYQSPKRSYPANFFSFRVILDVFLAFYTCGVCEGNPCWGVKTADPTPHKFPCLGIGLWPQSEDGDGMDFAFPVSQDICSCFIRVGNGGSAVWLGKCVKNSVGISNYAYKLLWNSKGEPQK